MFSPNHQVWLKKGLLSYIATSFFSQILNVVKVRSKKSRVNAVFSECADLSSAVVFFFSTSTLQMFKLVFQTLKVIIFSVIYIIEKKVNSVFPCFTQVLISET